MAFPQSYLDHVDCAMTHAGWDVGAPGAGAIAINAHWDGIGGAEATTIRRGYNEPAESILF
jgi:hypothetical protein